MLDVNLIYLNLTYNIIYQFDKQSILGTCSSFLDVVVRAAAASSVSPVSEERVGIVGLTALAGVLFHRLDCAAVRADDVTGTVKRGKGVAGGCDVVVVSIDVVDVTLDGN